MMRTRNNRTCVLALLLLGGCGGGGGGGSGGADTSPVVTPTPSTPSTPTPVTPAAPSTPNYPLASDYGTNFSFTSLLGYAADQFVSDRGESTSLGVYLLPDDRTTSLTFIAQPEEARVNYAGDPVAFTGAERLISGVDTQRAYRRDDALLVLDIESNPGARYVTKAVTRLFQGADTLNGVAGRRARLGFSILGAATEPADLPADPGMFRGRSILWGGAQSDQFTNKVDMTSTLSFRAGDTVVGSIANVDNGNLVLTGRLDRNSGKIAGTLDNGAKTITGTFKGRLFGPQGREVALVFFARRSGDRAEFAGDYIGVR